MQMNVKGVSVLEKWSESMKGVFTLADLRALYSDISDDGLYRKLKRMQEAQLLIKVKRGLYARPSASLVDISARIEPAAYISTGTVLERCMMVGSIPARRVQAVKVGVPRIYKCKLGVIEHLSIAQHLYFGFSKQDGICVATPEKAWIDACYFTYKGRAFSFDLDTDVDKSRLDDNLLTEYLEPYDVRFREHFNRNWRS
jgi:hypothetical protein